MLVLGIDSTPYRVKRPTEVIVTVGLISTYPVGLVPEGRFLQLC